MKPELLYLNLMKKSLTRFGEDSLVPITCSGAPLTRFLKRMFVDAIARRRLELLRRVPFDREKRETGRDFPRDVPSGAMTMIGMKRLDNLQACIDAIVREDVPGDLVEAGVWKGGASIFMRGALAAFGDQHRLVWCADSFQGLPAPDLAKYPQDSDVDWHEDTWLAISLDQVKDNFRAYGLLDERVRFLPGWFKDTLPGAPIETISLLRLDGDMYESTMDTLTALYPKLSPGGFIVVDDYGIPQDTCRRAIHDFRDANAISEPILDIDGWGAFWRRAG